jgi:hypothetical protein
MNAWYLRASIHPLSVYRRFTVIFGACLFACTLSVVPTRAAEVFLNSKSEFLDVLSLSAFNVTPTMESFETLPSVPNQFPTQSQMKTQIVVPGSTSDFGFTVKETAAGAGSYPFPNPTPAAPLAQATDPTAPYARGFVISSNAKDPVKMDGSHGSDGFNFLMNQDGREIVFVFNEPLRAFGLLTTDWGDTLPAGTQGSIRTDSGLVSHLVYSNATNHNARPTGGGPTNNGIERFVGIVSDTPFAEFILSTSNRNYTSYVDTIGYDEAYLALARDFRQPVVPEPSSLLLALLGGVGVAVYGWRRQRARGC